LSLAVIGDQNAIGKVTDISQLTGADNTGYQVVTWLAPDNSTHSFITTCVSHYYINESLAIHRIYFFDWQINQLSC
jgi:hypothetical protein